MKKVFYTLVCFPFLFSCHFFDNEREKDAIAKVGEEYLYLEDIENFSAETPEDSIKKVQNYIYSWVKEQLLLQKALDNLGDEQANFEKQLKNYRNSLLIYAYETQFIKQKLDTVVTQVEFEEYYLNNAQNFKLKEPIVNCLFINYLNSAPKIDSLEYWMFKGKNAGSLDKYCTQFALGCHLDSNSWIPFTKIKELTGTASNNNIYLSKGKNLLSDTTQSLLVNVFELKNKEDIAPLSYVKEQIRSIILNKRKIQLISEVKEEIFEEATLNDKYEIFED